METDWGIRDDATNRFVEFIGVAWPKEHLEENLKFVADSLGPTNGGAATRHDPPLPRHGVLQAPPVDVQEAANLLAVLQRQAAGLPVSRLPAPLPRRHVGPDATEYVIPLQGQIAARIEQLEGDKAKATSTSHRNKLQKEQDDLKKQQAELQRSRRSSSTSPTRRSHSTSMTA